MHEQDNKVVKASGGALGLRRWMMAGPELARLLRQYESGDDDLHDNDPEKKPLLTLNTMNRDLVHREPFSDRLTAYLIQYAPDGEIPSWGFAELVTLDSNCSDEVVVNTIRIHADIGIKKYQE